MDNFAPVLILCLAFLGSSMVIDARRSHQSPPPAANNTATYDVLKYGAVGDGTTDDTKAFKSAWEAACGKKGIENAKIAVGSGKTFLVSQITFEGPCTSTTITFQILGKIVAPPRSAWKKKGSDEWLYFHRVDGLSLMGNGQGLIDGRGSTWWKHEEKSNPTAMRFSHCNKLSIKGLKHVNSQKNHISINGCKDATISDLVITAPAKSPNTDGIDVSGSTNVHILDSSMATGDDCIAINGGTSNVIISNINCGPGHGISIGSLGKNGKHDEVENINVSNCTFNRTDNGVRIKTWQGGSGFARNIKFSQITFIEAKNPVIIDQYYCPHKKCSNKKSAVKVSDVGYYGLHGTTINKNPTINLSCSQTVPCTNIIMEDVNIESADPKHSTKSRCINAYGTARALKPTLDCLLRQTSRTLP